MLTRRKFFIKTKHKRRRHAPPFLRREIPEGSAEAAEAAPASWPPPPRPAAKPPKTWRDHAITSGKLLAALLVAGYGIYFFATATPGRPVYLDKSARLPHTIPTHPGHRGAASSQNTGAIVEHSLADRLAPTDQSFRDTFGGSRSIGPDRGDVGSGGEPQVLPDKVKLREDLAGECEVGGNGRFDIEKCLRRHSVAGN